MLSLLRVALATLVPDSSRAAWRIRRSHLLRHWIVHTRSRRFAVTDQATLIVAPHADDETLGCGGLIACKRFRNVPVQVLFLTDGRLSHDAHPELGVTRADVIHIRRAEARQALDALGVSAADTFFLNHADGGLSNLTAAQREQVLSELTARLEALQPGEVYVPHRNDNHPDHRAAYTLTRAALARWGRSVTLLEYPVWLFWWRSVPLLDLKLHELAGAYCLPLTGAQRMPDTNARKQAAVSAYKSQAAILPPGFLSQFRIPIEIFFCPGNDGTAADNQHRR